MIGAFTIFVVACLVIYLATLSPLAPAFEALGLLFDLLSLVGDILGAFSL